VLASGIAHDFNNLLGSIGAQSELMMEEVQDSSLREGISRIQSVAMRASEIGRQLLVYAGQESGTLELVDLAALAREMLALIKVSDDLEAGMGNWKSGGVNTLPVSPQ